MNVAPGTFDPARDGFGFRNPVGVLPVRRGVGVLLRRFDAFLYGSGLCFGMAAAALANHVRPDSPYPLVALRPTPEVLEILRGYHARQLWPRCVLAAVVDWVRGRGGGVDGLLGRLRLAGASPDPHIVNFGPGLNGRFVSCLMRAHAVVPYRVDVVGGEERLYVHDPNQPGDSGRFAVFRDGGFWYGGFSSEEGWGITLVPLSAVMRDR